MKKKLLGIVVIMLMITTVVAATNINGKNNIQTITSRPTPDVPGLNWGVDQKQTDLTKYGITLIPPSTMAQSFTPTKDKLTAISLALFKGGNPPISVHITVTIRESLTGSDLVTKTIDTSDVTISTARWIMFDFEDISITPGSKYFIICSGDGGNETNAYCWGYTQEQDLYPNGEAWGKDNETSKWYKWMGVGNDPDDFCFKTYYKKPITSSILINLVFLSILEGSPHSFPLLQKLMGY